VIAMKRESLDTNVILRLTLRDIPSQFETAKKLVTSKRVRFFVSDITLFEYVYILEGHYEFSRKQIAEMVEKLLAQKNIDCNRELAVAALAHFVAHHSLSYADCYLAASARYMNAAPLWTFDKSLAKKLPDVKSLN